MSLTPRERTLVLAAAGAGCALALAAVVIRERLRLLMASHERDHRVAAEIPRKEVHVVGDVYLDMIAKVDGLPSWDSDTRIEQLIETTAGGSALNTASQLAALIASRGGAPGASRDGAFVLGECVMHSLLGEDLYGDVVDGLIRRETSVSLRARRSGGQGVCFCLSGQTDRAFVSYKGTVERLSVLDLDAAEIVSPKTAHVHIGSFYDCSGLRPGLRALLERVKADTAATVSLVPQSDSTADGEALEQLLSLLPLIDVLICNEAEAAAMASVEPGRVAEAVDALVELGGDDLLVVVTLGKDGALARCKSDRSWWRQRTKRVDVVDTTGAGDAFAAGFLYGWLGGRDVRRGLVYGCACGAAAVGQMGGSRPLPAAAIDECMHSETPRLDSHGAWERIKGCESLAALRALGGHGDHAPAVKVARSRSMG